MLLEKDQHVVMNKKKIERIKKKFNLKTKIRVNRAIYKKMAQATQEHKTCPNHLARKFKREKPDDVYSTDITQLNYGRGKKAYLAIFKDLCTKEIVSYSVSERPDLNLVNKALDGALENLKQKKKQSLIIHSDQGFQFTHEKYRKKLEIQGITQSMSRRGNCYDNAPAETFFGYIKDHLDLKNCNYFQKVEKIVTEEIEYYNKQRPQEGLKKMPPFLFRRHLKSDLGLF